MKKVINQVLTMFFVVLITGIGFSVLFSINLKILSLHSIFGLVFAESKGIDLQKSAQTLSDIMQMLYMVMWPLIAIGGKAVDNSFVYGSVFHLDIYLWQLWNIMKNFANYALGFIFVFSVLAYFFDMGSGKISKFPPKKIIPKVFVASILIQMSWFLIGAILDISTVLTYAVGSLPLTVVKEKNIADNPILQTYSLVDYSIADSSTKKKNYIYWGYGQDRFLPCFFSSGGIIVAGDELNKKFNDRLLKDIKDDKQNSSFHYKNDVLEQFGKDDPKSFCKDLTIQVTGADNKLESKKIKNECILSDSELNNVQVEYCVYAGGELLHIDEGKGVGGVLIIDNKNVNKIKESKEDGELFLRNTPIQNGANSIFNLKSLNAKLGGLTGPLYTFYYSLMRFSQGSLSGDVGSGADMAKVSFFYVINLFFGIALLLPLFALALVFVVRTFYLWAIIVFIPILALSYIFGFGLGKIGDKFSINSILWLMFMPVVAMFTLSMNLVVMNILQKSISLGSESSLETENAFGMVLQKDNSNDAMGSFSRKMVDSGFTMKFAQLKNQGGVALDVFLDMFSRLVVNCLGIIMLWSTFFAVLKTSKITAGIAGQIETFGKGLATATPIIPVPGAGMTNWYGLTQGMPNQFKSAIRGIPGQQYEKSGLNKFLDSVRESMEGVDGKFEEALKESQQAERIVGDKNIEESKLLGLNKLLQNYNQFGSSRSMYDRESQIIKAISNITNESYSNLGEALSDQKVIPYMNIQKIIENAGSHPSNKDEVQKKLKQQISDAIKKQIAGKSNLSQIATNKIFVNKNSNYILNVDENDNFVSNSKLFEDTSKKQFSQALNSFLKDIDGNIKFDDFFENISIDVNSIVANKLYLSKDKKIVYIVGHEIQTIELGGTGEKDAVKSSLQTILDVGGLDVSKIFSGIGSGEIEFKGHKFQVEKETGKNSYRLK